MFVFGDFNIQYKDWLTYSGGTDRPGELCYNFAISNDLIQMVNFPNQIPDHDSKSHVPLDFFLSSDASICSTMAFHPLQKKTLWPLFMDAVQLSQGYRATLRRQFTFYH